ncbi:unnamed protein product [Effrenium voratum]|nr:unnamed protein product [Effrenium voratum]
MASHEWLWQSLRAGQHALITGLAPQDFDWKSSHPVFGSPLMATVHRAVLDGGPEVIEMVRLCMRMGADPRTSVRSASALSVGLPPPPPAQGWHCYDDSGRIWWQYDGMLGLYWCEDNQKHDSDSYSCPEGELTLKVIAEEHSGHSAISLLLAIKRKLECWGAAYKHYMKRIDSLCSVFMEGGLVLHDPWKTLQYINEGVVQTWSSIMGDQDRADVELKAGGESSVWAHGLVLCNASPVLKAALGSLMREGRTQKVEVSCSEEALRHLLALIYTGCPEKETTGWQSSCRRWSWRTCGRSVTWWRHWRRRFASNCRKNCRSSCRRRAAADDGGASAGGQAEAVAALVGRVPSPGRRGQPAGGVRQELQRHGEHRPQAAPDSRALLSS